MMHPSAWDDEQGQGAAEYALVLAAVVVLVLTTAGMLSQDLQDLVTDIGTYMNDAFF